MKIPSLRAVIAAGTGLLVAVSGLAMATTASSAPEPRSASANTQHQWLTGYWHNFDNGSTVMRVRDIPEAYNLVAIAFADNLAGTPGGITFNLASDELNGYTEQEFKDDVAAVRAQGRKVIISVGGEKGNVLINSAAAAKNFADTTWSLMQEYGFDGVDIDLEHGIDAEHISDALHQLRAKAGPGLIITMAPQTIDYQAVTMPYYKLTNNIKDILTIVNMQYYNSGSMLGCDSKVYSQGTPDFLAALACIQLEMGLRPDQVGLGVPAVRSAAGGGYLPASDVVKAIDCLEEGKNCGNFSPTTPYGPIGGAMTWSVNWDATNNYQFANTMSARLNTGGDWTPPTEPTDPPTTEPTDPPTTEPTDPPTTEPTDPPTTEPPACDVTTWSNSRAYVGGDRVSYDGKVYVAKWWVQGEAPSTTPWGPWSLIEDCDSEPDTGTPATPEPMQPTEPSTPPTNGECAPAWNSSSAYSTGDTVTHNGAEWVAKWWTMNEKPGATSWGAWQNTGTC